MELLFSSLGECVIRCKQRSDCRSIDYHQKYAFCNLSSKDRVSAGADYTEPCYSEPHSYLYMEKL